MGKGICSAGLGASSLMGGMQLTRASQALRTGKMYVRSYDAESLPAPSKVIYRDGDEYYQEREDVRASFYPIG